MSFKFNPFTGKLDVVEITDVGGKYGINVETLTGNKTLTSNTDEMYQFLNANGTHRTITLDTASASAGDRFIIRNTVNWNLPYYLEIKQSTTTLDKCCCGTVKTFIFDGTNWKFADNGTGDATDDKKNTAIGAKARAYNYSIAVGYDTSASSAAISIGYAANSTNNGVSIGFASNATNYGVAIGRSAKTNSKHYGVALGYYSETERYAEIAHNINGSDTDQENNITIGGWEGSTTDATPLEIFCGGIANQRFTIRPSSVLGFRLIVTARDNVAGHVGMWTISNGVIKRDGVGNTAMATAATVTEIVDESGDWSVAVTADDTNESLKIEVTGDATNPVQWAARLDGVETHF